jgi:hypothetical protein
MTNSPTQPNGPLRPALGVLPTVVLLGAFFMEFAVVLGDPMLHYAQSVLYFLLIALPAVMYWLLASGQTIRVSRFKSEVLIIAAMITFGLICMTIAAIETPHGRNSWRMWLEGIGMGLADILVVTAIFSLLRQTLRSPWWACFWVFGIGPFAELSFPLWLPATVLLLAAFRAYNSKLRPWAGVCLALSTLACPFVTPVAVVAAVGVWRERKHGRIAQKDARFIAGSFAGLLLAAATLLLFRPIAIHDWANSFGSGIGYTRWPMIRLLHDSSQLRNLYCFEAVAWLTGVVTVATAAIRCKWPVARTAVHLCVLSLILCPFYFYLFLLPIVALGTLAWNRSAFWLATISVLLVQGRSRSYSAHHSYVLFAEWLLWMVALGLEVIQLVADMVARPAQPA